jgi:hypothetical protein
VENACFNAEGAELAEVETEARAEAMEKMAA